MKKTILAAVAVLLLFAACAPGPNTLSGSADAEGEVDGFWDGLWHGIIMPVTFVVSLFSDDVGIYEIRNSGGWYNFGFLLGLMIILGGGSKGASSSRR
jgi:hypothetical protein